MLRRLTLGLFTLACAAAIAACSTGNTTPSSGGVPGTGPNFVTNTIYVSDTTQNAVDIYTPSPGPSATPQYLIGGSSSSLDGPSYLAFDSSKNLYVTNYGASTKVGSVTIYKTFATGNVIPFGSASLGGEQPHGIAMIPSNGGFVVAFTQPGGFFSNGIAVYAPFRGPGNAFQTNLIAGSNTNLNNPIGVAVDANKNIYAANSGGGNITVYTLPTPSPTPSGSPSPTPSPTPTPTAAPSGAPTPTPSPSPTPFSQNLPPTETITCACLKQPTGLAFDGSGNLYVTDPASSPAAVYEFPAAQLASGTVSPSRTLTGAVNPTDVTIDSSGTIYVVDAGNAPGKSMLLIYAAGASTPATSIALPGTATGIALSP
ncbi:MAG TPA: hypothetical protein VFN37_09340 [Candidatus Baltobacteraceae bacterium]|nr:hypothetical protein [Candidatus Baltobacteraceae bacterium]